MKILNLEFIKPWLLPCLPLLARVIFASTLAHFFWQSALTKFDGPFALSIGAYGQIFPKSFEAVGYDPSQLSSLHFLIAYFGAIAELILPAMIILGLFTRLSALAMIGFICVLTFVDIFGHGATTGMVFDGDPYGIIADQRLYWGINLLIILALGGGKFALERLLGWQDKS